MNNLMKTSVSVNIIRTFGEEKRNIYLVYDNCSIEEYFEKHHCTGDIVESIEKIEPPIKLNKED